MKNFIFRFFEIAERAFAYLQGKGYGAATIDQEVRAIKRLLKSAPKIAVDVGANIGNYTNGLRNVFPNIEIHAFEPVKENVTKLNRRFKDECDIRIIPYALSVEGGVAVLYSDFSGSGMGSLTKRRLDHFGIDFNCHENVATIRFEDYWKNTLSCALVDIVKLDIEGHELDALIGFGHALKSIGIIQFEFGGTNIDTRNYFQDFWYLLTSNDFEIHRITPFGSQRIAAYKEIDELFLTTNYLAVNKHYPNKTN